MYLDIYTHIECAVVVFISNYKYILLDM